MLCIRYMTKTLRVTDETHTELIKLGKYGESMDDILQRLIKKAKS
jgi:predicted CopG family antitoxin